MNITNERLKKCINSESTALNIILVAVALGTVVFVATVAPALPVALKSLGLLNLNNRDRRRLSKSYYYAKKKGYISEKKSGNRIRPTLTKEGKDRVKMIVLDDIKIEKPRRWDKRWRMVMFDIPVRFTKGREGFRLKLQEWGFHQMQKSVWVFPYPCFEQVGELADFYGVGRYLVFVESSNINLEEKLRERFGLLAT